MKAPQFNPGSITHGTLNSEHLLRCYIGELEAFRVINGAYFSLPENFAKRDEIANAIGEMQDCFNNEWEIDPEKDEIASELVNETIPNLFDKYAPHGHSFHSHPGDGSDLGFWENKEE